MPLTAWYCKGCNGDRVPLDHFDTSECGERVCHPNYAARVLHRANHHRDKLVPTIAEVSHGIGCVRQYAMMDAVDYAIDPQSNNAVLSGSAFHAEMEKGETEGAVAETYLIGEVGGIPLQGTTDLLRRAKSLIEDWKCSNDFVAKYVKKEGPKRHYVLQLGLYAPLVQQQEGWTPTRGILWHQYRADGLIPKPVPILPIEEVLAAKPKGGEFTVQELLQSAANYWKGAVKWQDLPLAGKSQSFGTKSACDYCALRPQCWEQATGAPF